MMGVKGPRDLYDVALWALDMIVLVASAAFLAFVVLVLF